MQSSSKYSLIRRIGSALLSAAMIGSVFAAAGSLLPFMQAPEVSAASTVDYGLADTSQHGVILHCWNWSYNNIKKYMKDIAAAGYTSIQTSPVQQPKDYYWEGVAYGNVGIPNGTGGEDGNWWKAYQPVTFSICDNGYTWYGTKAEFKAMCDEAEKYGVKVIVDIVANHMGNIQGYKIADKSMTLAEQQKAVMSDISPQVGEFWKKDMLTDPSYWHISTSWTHSSDERFDVTQGNMGMPDLNTGDSKVQQMVLGLLKECIDCGADGFRFDAAKHIETPKDDPAFASNFWDVVLDGARAYYKQKNGYDGIYFYGEVLNRLDDPNAENYYLSKMSLTDNSKSDNLRNSVINGSVESLADSGFNGYIHGKADHAVLWPESHDTYMGGGSSYDANDRVIKQVWAIVASRKDSTGLFFARPYYSKDILAGDVSQARQSTAAIMENIDEQTQLGDVGTLTWADPAVVAANRFRNYFVGQSERLGASGHTAYNLRGKTGIVIVRGGGPGAVSLSVGMQDGTYYDQVTGEKFTVSGGVVKGNVKNADGIAVVYNPSKDYGKVTPVEPTVIRLSAESANGSNIFTTDTVSVTMKNPGRSTVKYTTSEGQSGSFTGASKTITIGNYTATGDAVTLTMTGTKDGITKSKSYAFTKKVISSEYPTLSKGGVVFDNSSYNWAKVYVYVYDESGSSVVNNDAWPGEPMSEEHNDYWSYEFPSKFTGNVNIIFNNSSGVQYPSGTGLAQKATDKKLFKDQKLVDLPASVKTLAVSLNASSAKPAIGQNVTLTANASHANGTVKYTFLCSDGTTIKAASTSSTCTWTPSKAGTYTIAVKAQDSALSITQTVKLTVSTSAKLASNSGVSANAVAPGNSVTLKGAAVGGTAPYQYAFYYKKAGASAYTRIREYGTADTATFKPASVTSYELLIKVKDKTGAVVSSKFDLTVTGSAKLKNTSKVSAESISLGSRVSLYGSATGGTAPYQYAYYFKKSTASAYAALKAYSSTSYYAFTPAGAHTYDLMVKVKDAKGTIAKQTFRVVVKSTALTNTSTLSATSIKRGSSVTASASATGGKTPYQYGVYYKKAISETWTTAQSYGSNKTVSFKPAAATTYDVCVKVKDSSGTIAKKYFTVKVTK